MSSSFPTEPSYVDTFNMLPTQSFLEKITEFYIEGTNLDILTNGTLQNGTFIATFSSSVPQFIGNSTAGLFCINTQDQITGNQIIPLSNNDVQFGYNNTTASYNLSLNKRFSPSGSPRSFALGIDSGEMVDILFVGKIEASKLRNLAPMKQRFLDTFKTFLGTSSDYQWYAGLATLPEPLNINKNSELANFVILNSSPDFINNAITQGGTYIGSGVGSTEPGFQLAQHHKYGTFISVNWNESSTCVTSLFNETSFVPSQADLLYNSMFVFGYLEDSEGTDTLVAFAGTTPETGILPYAKGDNNDENLIDYYAFYPKIDIKSSEIIII
jgi:hypothetical protein